MPLRYGRMLVSYFTFYRGSAGIMAANLACTPATGIRVHACGDCHLMNFGGFATPERRLIFDINDLDETLPAPWEWDIKRLVTSFVLWRAATACPTKMGETLRSPAPASTAARCANSPTWTWSRAKSERFDSFMDSLLGRNLIHPACWARRPARMAKSLSEDLRSRLIAAVDGGMSRRGAAERFGVSVASAIRWLREWHTTGATRAKPRGGDLRSHRIEAYRDVILAAVEAKVDITLVELSQLLRDRHGASFARSTIWRCLDRHAMTLKKNSARQRAGTARRRRAASGLVRRTA